ncbi:nucleolar RNA helicase 2-like isoform X2 [Saccoglossus kowalevskii]|uniref:RNA helicase n=1 Tax=Saccoglossus kowalevskii TaxID=10224 RepID=A0ABM0ML90_SACKO|nr:PREDICTED: nucleolar RNA helicase 2-like isoform X2 [Saccoglossus kowalevskii]
MPVQLIDTMEEEVKNQSSGSETEVKHKKSKKSKKDAKEKIKKDKKNKKRKHEDEAEAEAESSEVKIKKSKKHKKEKKDDSGSESSNTEKPTKKEVVDVTSSNHSNNDKTEVTEEPKELTKEEKAGAFSNFRLSPQTIASLKARSITHLFPIQAKTFDYVYDGHDVIAQARTGTGKTLAFALPLVEKLKNTEFKAGRPPQVLVMAPTRELAKQVSEDFQASNPRLSTLCVYGGTAYWPQESAIRRGVDVLVGTPGRILDYVQKNTLNLSQLKHVILDEVDRMLDMGFADTVEEILSASYKMDNPGENPQTLLFSATLPEWVYRTAKKYMKSEIKRVDLIGQQKLKTATTVEHLAIRCHYRQRAATISDVVQVYSGKHGRCMIFTETKKDANEMGLSSSIRQDVQVLHGDIAQNQREITLKGFRDGKFRCLVATDVAARGLDIPEVDLIVMCEPPKDAENYIHRSGRTGRAGRTGVSVCFYKPNEEHVLKLIERRAGIKFRRVGAPQPEDIIKTSADDALKSLDAVPESAIKLFHEAAEKLIEEKGPVEALAAALALVSGATDVTSRSLLNSDEGYTTYIFSCQTEMRALSYVWRALGNQIPEDVKEKFRGMRMCTNTKSAVFDVPNDVIPKLESHWVNRWGCTLEQAQHLPDIIETSTQGRNGFGRGGFGRGGFGGRGGRGRKFGGISRRDKPSAGNRGFKNNSFFSN